MRFLRSEKSIPKGFVSAWTQRNHCGPLTQAEAQAVLLALQQVKNHHGHPVQILSDALVIVDAIYHLVKAPWDCKPVILDICNIFGWDEAVGM